MAHRFRPWTTAQLYLLPPALNDWVDDDHLIHFVADVVRTLDMSEIEATYLDKDPRGAVPYDPRICLLCSSTRTAEESRRLGRSSRRPGKTWQPASSSATSTPTTP